MKAIRLMVFLLVTSNFAWAQITEGKIVYEQTVNMHRSLPSPEMKNFVPEFRTSKYELLFVENKSLYKEIQEEEAPDPFSGGGGQRFMFRMGMGQGESYRDYNLNKLVEKRALGEKQFIIEDTLNSLAWKLTDETKQIAGYTCRKATAVTKQTNASRRIISTVMNGSNPAQKDTTMPITQKEVTIEAWFTDAIPTPIGPASFGKLPGAILALDIDNGQMVYNAVEISTKIKKADVKEPTKGKKVTKEEFNALMKEMMENMQIPGGMRMRMQ
ncbi:MAG: GLPGLI family protein [Chitinophagaceae bacterium]